jgi:hypothetical protein
MSYENKNIPLTYQTLASVLREGKENCKTSKEIIKALGWNSNDSRRIFHIVEELITKYGYLIGSSRKGEHRGYYIISNFDEYLETMKTYNSQIQSMLNRHRKLQENYAKKDQLQANL